MGPRRGRSPSFALLCALAALALVAAGCGVQEHPNDPRPSQPTRVSVIVNEKAVIVQPPRIAIGPEPTQQIPQNQHASQPSIHSNAPLDVVVVSSNLTDANSRIVLHGPGREAASQPLVAHGNVTLQTNLPTGVYTVSAAGIPSAKPAKLVVGPYRNSSENDVLQP